MKKLFFGLITTVLFAFTGNAQSIKIGIVTKEGNFDITENIDFIKDSWNKNLKELKLNDILVDFTIREAIDKETNEKYYYLLGANKTATIKTATLLKLFDNSFMLDELSNSSGSITCSGCTITCNPEYWKSIKRWVCSSGCPECTKSVTVNFLTNN